MFKNPPVPPPIEQVRITKEQAISNVNQARQKLFEIEKGRTYNAILEASDKGSFYIALRYPENCNTSDIIKLQAELREKGFKVELSSGVYDSLEISWYPE